MGCCNGTSALPRETPAGTSYTAAVRSNAAETPRRTLQSRAGGRTVNHFLAAVRRGGLESVPSQLFQAYARYLGLNPDEDAELLWIAELAARAPMPVGWTEHFDSQGRLFYYHAERRSSWWTHPLEEEHRSVHRRITEFRNRGAVGGDVSLGGLRGELWQLEAEAAEAEHGWVEHWDQEGHIFFFNRRERVSSWTDPRPAIRHRLLLRQRAVRCLLGCPEPPEEEAPYLEVEPDRPAWLEEREKKGDNGRDAWQSPRLLLMDRAAECPVCYDPLWTSRPSVLTSVDGRRICGHYFCLSCAQRLQTGCAVCRARAAEGGPCRARALPSVEKRPWQWFAMVDVDGDGRLEQAEAVKALEAVLPLDAERLWRALGANPKDGSVDEQLPVGAGAASAISDDEEEDEAVLAPALEYGLRAPPLLMEDTGGPVPLPPPPPPPCENEVNSARNASVDGSGWWCEWEQRPDAAADDAAGVRGISAEAFCAEGGMLQWIVENLGELRRAEEAGEPPDLEREKLERWFDFWDADADGGLSKSELLRALMKTLRVSGVERRQVTQIRSTIEQCFHSWADDGNERVSREAFLSKPDGLGELLLAALFPPSPQAPDPRVQYDDEDLEGTGPWPPMSPEAPPPELQELGPQYTRSESGLLSQKLMALRTVSERSIGTKNEWCAQL